MEIIKIIIILSVIINNLETIFKQKQQLQDKGNKVEIEDLPNNVNITKKINTNISLYYITKLSKMK